MHREVEQQARETNSILNCDNVTCLESWCTSQRGTKANIIMWIMLWCWECTCWHSCMTIIAISISPVTLAQYTASVREKRRGGDVMRVWAPVRADMAQSILATHNNKGVSGANFFFPIICFCVNRNLAKYFFKNIFCGSMLAWEWRLDLLLMTESNGYYLHKTFSRYHL